jgi:MFS family permease
MSETAITVTPSCASVPWWKEVTREQWYALLAGKMGWALDAFDVMLYVFCLKVIMDQWALNPAVAGFMVSVTLFASSFGGILFGVVADRIGRKKALMATVLLFSICSGLSGLAQNLVQLAIARTLLGIGMGGEWASGALLVSETWPAKHRGKAIGLMQGGWAIGYIAAAIAAATILPRYGWRVMFFLGIRPHGQCPGPHGDRLLRPEVRRGRRPDHHRDRLRDRRRVDLPAAGNRRPGTGLKGRDDRGWTPWKA